MATDFNSKKVPELKNYLSERLIRNLSIYRKAQLVQLCVFIQRFDVPVQPTLAQRIAEKTARLEEVLTVSPTLKLPSPDSDGLSWSAALSDVPEINILHLYNYFILSESPAFSSEKIKAYKSMTHYRNALEGFVDEIFICNQFISDGWIFIRGKVFASQKANTKYNVWSLLNKEVCG